MSEIQRTELSREMGLFTLTMVGVGAMIGAGIFVLTGEAAGVAGPALILAFALNGVVSLLTAMTYAELGSSIPEAGGGYLWIKEGLPGSNAFLAGWMSWFAHAVAGALYALGFGAFVYELCRIWEVPWDEWGVSLVLAKKVLGVLIVLIFAYINFRGASETGLAGNIVTVAKLAVIFVFCFFGLKFMFAPDLLFTVGSAAGGAGLSQLQPLIPQETGWLGIVSAMGITFIAFEGYEIIVQAGEEVRDPRRNVPKAVFLSLAIVIPVYMLVAFVLVGASKAPLLWATIQSMGGEIPAHLSADSANWQLLRELGELGLAQAAAQFIPYGAVLILFGGVLSTMSALNATTYSSTRVSFAMGRDRNLPDAFAAVHERNHTPYLALFWTTLLILGMVVFVPITTVAAAADVMFLLLFLQVNLAVLRLRRQHGGKLAYGFVMPLIVYVTILAIVTKLLIAVILVHHYPMAWVYSGAWIGVGFLVWRAYARERRTEAEAEEAEAERAPVVSEQAPVTRSSHSVLVAVERSRPDEELVRLGARIAATLESEAVLVHAVPVPKQLPLRDGRRIAGRADEMLENARRIAEEEDAKARTVVRLTRHTEQGILRAAEERDSEYVVMGWRAARKGRRFRLGMGAQQVLRRANRHVVLGETTSPQPERPSDRPLKVLVPVSKADKAALALGVASSLAGKGFRARIDLLHLTDDGSDGEEKEAFREDIREQIETEEGTEPSALFGEDSPVRFDFRSIEKSVSDDIVKLSEDYDRIVIGMGRRSLLGRKLVSPISADVADRAECQVLLVRPADNIVLFGIHRFVDFLRAEDERVETDETDETDESEETETDEEDRGEDGAKEDGAQEDEAEEDEAQEENAS